MPATRYHQPAVPPGQQHRWHPGRPQLAGERCPSRPARLRGTGWGCWCDAEQARHVLQSWLLAACQVVMPPHASDDSSCNDQHAPLEQPLPHLSGHPRGIVEIEHAAAGEPRPCNEPRRPPAIERQIAGHTVEACLQECAAQVGRMNGSRLRSMVGGKRHINLSNFAFSADRMLQRVDLADWRQLTTKPSVGSYCCTLWSVVTA